MPTRKQTTTQDQAENVAAPAAGGATGIAAGAAIGAVAGGPVGAAVGAAIGGPIGAALGSAATWSEAEPHFRSQWESGPYKAITKWEDVSPAYRYGFENRVVGPVLVGMSYEDASPRLRKGWSSKTRYDDVEPMIRSAWEVRGQGPTVADQANARGRTSTRSARASGSTMAEGEAVIPVVEEELQVGKRKVEKGGVKVKTTVTERPVEEQVRLHEEHVEVKRRPVNRELKAGDKAFTEGTIEMTETAEEAVVAKRARVVEEVVIGKHGSDRTETVRDTVRRSDVDVQKTGGHAAAGPVQWETISGDFRKDFGTRYGKSGSTFEEYTPAYRFGYNLANDERYRGDWSTVEPQARTLWEGKNAGTWSEFKDAVHHAWEKVRGRE